MEFFGRWFAVDAQLSRQLIKIQYVNIYALSNDDYDEYSDDGYDDNKKKLEPQGTKLRYKIF
jgi:hypothetical protein